MLCPGISFVALTNFRAFRRKTRVPLRRLTFLVGPNSSGKTSLLHGIFLAIQSGFPRLSNTRPVWSGSLTDLGSFADTVFRHDVSRTIGVELGMVNLTSPFDDRRKPISATLSCAMRAVGDPAGYLARSRVTDPDSGLALEIGRRRGRYPSYTVGLQGITATWNPTADDSLYRSGFDDVVRSVLIAARRRGSGISARSIAQLSGVVQGLKYSSLSLGLQRVSSARAAPERWYKNAITAGARDRESARLDALTPEMFEPRTSRRRGVPTKGVARDLHALDIAESIQRRALSAYHSGTYVIDSKTGIEANLADVGYGASQVLPVLWALNTASTAPLVLEQPEVHLHPRAQGVLADLVVAASQKRQILVETHSEHVINHARIAIAQGKLAPEDAIVLYVERTNQGSRVTEIGFDQAGDFVGTWPGGFFDERFQDAMLLAELRGSERGRQ